MIDNSGKPRSGQDLIEARHALKKAMINPRNFSPILVFYPTLINAIDELLERRDND